MNPERLNNLSKAAKEAQKSFFTNPAHFLLGDQEVDPIIAIVNLKHISEGLKQQGFSND